MSANGSATAAAASRSRFHARAAARRGDGAVAHTHPTQLTKESSASINGDHIVSAGADPCSVASNLAANHARSSVINNRAPSHPPRAPWRNARRNCCCGVPVPIPKSAMRTRAASSSRINRIVYIASKRSQIHKGNRKSLQLQSNRPSSRGGSIESCAAPRRNQTSWRPQPSIGPSMLK